MGVYFALRTHYDFSTGKYLCYFPEDDSVLAWFQRHWQGKSEEGEEATQYADEILGCSVYGFDSLFRSITEHNLTVPKTMRQLSAILNEHLYVEGEVLTSANTIQVLTDDDELELAYYFFDDRYVAKEPEKAAYLLHDDWQLPVSVAGANVRLPRLPDALESFESAKRNQGEVYFVSYLHEQPVGENWFFEMKLLRALTASPKDDTSADITLADILLQAKKIPLSVVDDDCYKSDFGEKNTPAEDFALLAEGIERNRTDRALVSGKESLVQVAEHVAQLCLHTDTWVYSPGNETKLFTRWIFFDDVWLRAHPALGKAILRFGTRWDVLS